MGGTGCAPADDARPRPKMPAITLTRNRLTRIAIGLPPATQPPTSDGPAWFVQSVFLVIELRIPGGIPQVKEPRWEHATPERSGKAELERKEILGSEAGESAQLSVIENVTPFTSCRLISTRASPRPDRSPWLRAGKGVGRVGTAVAGSLGSVRRWRSARLRPSLAPA